MGNIYEKIANVMKNVDYMKKDGDVEFKNTKYKYLSAEKIVSNIRKEMIKEGLVIYPEKTEVTNQTQYEKDILVTYRIADIEGNSITVQVPGGGYDTTDKKTYKAMTGAYKYALRQTFMIETGDDDPDKTPSKPITDKSVNKMTTGDIKRLFLKKHNGDKEEAKKDYDMFNDLDEETKQDIINKMKEDLDVSL
jgi:hypothetical protein